MNTHETPFEIIESAHDIVLGAGTDFVARLVDAGTTFVTRGLAASGHPELALVLLRAPAAFPTDEAMSSAVEAMTAFLREMARMVIGGTKVSEGSSLSLANGLVAPHLQGLVWVKPPRLLTDPSVPAGALVGVPLFHDELELARETSTHRVLARLGMVAREFPFPPWLDAMRGSVAGLAAEQSSVLCRMPSMKAGVAFVAEHRQGNPRPEALVQLSLRVRASARSRLMNAFSTAPELEGPVALVGVPSDEVNAWLAWRPGQEGFSAIRAPGADFSKITGAFFAFAPDEDFEIDRAMMTEDGYMLFPTLASWGRLRAALASGAPLTLPLEHGRFDLTWDAD